jgi:hypothetical protein
MWLAGLGAALGAGARSWEEPAFPNWSGQFVDRILTNSPWAREVTVPFVFQPRSEPFVSGFGQIGAPRRTDWPPAGAASAVRTEMYLTIRWSSALPVRQALALAQFGKDGLEHPVARDLLSRAEPDYIVEIAGFPTTLFPNGTKELANQFARSARLLIDGRPPSASPTAEIPEHGMHLTASLRFPRFGEIVPEGVIRVHAEVGSARIQQQFKLKTMIYRERLEL